MFRIISVSETGKAPETVKQNYIKATKRLRNTKKHETHKKRKTIRKEGPVDMARVKPIRMANSN